MNLWIPFILIWLLMLPFAVILLPFLIILDAIMSVRRSWISLTRMSFGFIHFLASTRGTEINVTNPHKGTIIQIKII